MTDRAVFDRLIFPRLSAIAETGWTESASRDYARFTALVGLPTDGLRLAQESLATLRELEDPDVTVSTIQCVSINAIFLNQNQIVIAVTEDMRLRAERSDDLWERGFSLVWHDSVGPLADRAPAVLRTLRRLGPVDVQVGAIQGFNQISNGMRDPRMYIEIMSAPESTVVSAGLPASPAWPGTPA